MKGYLLFGFAFALLIAVWAAGCGGEPTAVAPGDELSEAQSQSAESRTLREKEGGGITLEPTREEATMTPLPANQPGEVTPPPEAQQVARLAVEDLVKRLNLLPEDIRLVSVEAVDWPDTSLGCPEPGMMYAQVITPGYRIELEAEGETYEYHTDTGDQIALCQPEGRSEESEAPATSSAATGSQPLAVAEPPTGDKPPEGAEEVVRLATEDLANRLGLAPEEIQLVSVEVVEWSDASLGCPQPGMMYAQVITPGFRIVLEVEKQGYEYHTDTGRFVVLCGEDGMPVFPQIPVDPDEIQDGKPWMSNHQ